MRFQNERFLIQAARYIGVSVDYLRRFTRAEIATLIEDRQKEEEGEQRFWHYKFAELFVITISSNSFRKKGARMPRVEDFVPKPRSKKVGKIKIDDGFEEWMKIPQDVAGD